MIFTNLDVTIEQNVDIKVIIVLAKWVDHLFCDFEPSHVKEELKKGEKGEIDLLQWGFIIRNFYGLLPKDGRKHEHVYS